jgi:hypothetical protein
MTRKRLNWKMIVKIVPIGLISLSLFVSLYLVQKQITLNNRANEPRIETLNRELKKAAKPNIFNLGEEKSVEELTIIVAERKEILKEEVKNNPGEFINHTLDRETINSLPQEISRSNLLEKNIETSGTLVIEHFDDFENHQSEEIHTLCTDDNYNQPEYVLHSEDNLFSEFKTNQTITVRGVALENDLVVSNITTSQELLQETIAPGEKKVAFIKFNFINDQSEPSPSGYPERWMEEVSSFYKEASLNQMTFKTDFLGTYTIPVENDMCQFYSWTKEVNDVIAKNGVNLADYDYRIYHFPDSGCHHDGWATTHAYIQGNTGPFVVAHELGHILGLGHASSIKCGQKSIDDYSNCTVEEYGNRFDIMGGYNDNLYHPNAAFKSYVLLKWIPEERIVDIKENGIYDVYPLEKETEGPQIYRVRKKDTTEEYYIQYRQPIGHDSSLRYFKHITEGISINIWGRAINTKLVDLSPSTPAWHLPDGETFIDEINEIKITQISHNDEFSRFSVELPLVIHPTFSPNPSMPPSPTPAPNAGKSLFLNSLGHYATINDNEGKTNIESEATIEAWINLKTNGAYDNGTIFGNFSSQNYTPVYALFFTNYEYLPNRSRPGFSIKTASGNNRMTIANDHIVDDGSQWTHLAITFKNSQVSIYINGKLSVQNEIDEQAFVSDQSILSLGAYLNKHEITSSFYGSIDDLRLSNIARDIETNWENRLYLLPLPVDENTIGLWRFEENLEDSGTNSLNGAGNVGYAWGRVPVIAPTPTATEAPTNTPTPTSTPTPAPTSTLIPTSIPTATLTPTITPTPTPITSCPLHLKNEFGYWKQGLNLLWNTFTTFKPDNNGFISKIEIRAGNNGNAQRELTCKITNDQGNDLSPANNSQSFQYSSGAQWRKISFLENPVFVEKGKTYRIYCKGPSVWNSLYWMHPDRNSPEVKNYRVYLCKTDNPITPTNTPTPTTAVQTTPTPTPPGPVNYCPIYRSQPSGTLKGGLNLFWTQYVAVRPMLSGIVNKIEVKAGNWGNAWRQITCKVTDNQGNDISQVVTSSPFNASSGADWREIGFQNNSFNVEGGETYRIYCKGPSIWNSLYWIYQNKDDPNSKNYRLYLCPTN